MLQQWQHVGGLSLAVAGTAFAAAFGAGPAALVAYGLAVALGGTLYLQGDRAAALGNLTGNILVGYLVGILVSLAIATGLLVWLLNVPPDYATWQIGLLMWDSWAGIGAGVLSGFFVTGLLALLT